jgi:hypothetical protein
MVLAKKKLSNTSGWPLPRTTARNASAFSCACGTNSSLTMNTTMEAAAPIASMGQGETQEADPVGAHGDQFVELAEVGEAEQQSEQQGHGHDDHEHLRETE